MTLTQPKPDLCWDPENLARAISLQAKVDRKQSHYFLACHSPVERIHDERLKHDLDEEELYQHILGRRTQRDFLGLVQGEAGTGKSHLIHWLKLRCQYDLEVGNRKDIVPVLIRRRTGSLKDTLEQLIEQLDQAFAKYLTPVKNALEKISGDTAKEKLANELSLEVGPRRVDRGKEALPKLLRHLDQACKAGGFSRWFCRDGGVIDQRITLLTQESAGHERATPPQFSAEDLLVETSYSRPNQNSGDVIYLIYELQDNPTLRQEAAEILNDALRDAILEMTGLSGGNLRTIFDRIRADLGESGQTLALFVEDVTAMSEFDTEVVNAVEPQDRLELCPLIAVLGLTDTGMGRLRANQVQRASLIVGVGDVVVREWLQDRQSLTRFAARYLNAVRLSESKIHEIAQHRSQNPGEDVNISKCDGCPASTECHKRFGSVRLNGVDVGMYPFTREAPYHLLNALVVDEVTEVRRNQRGLLVHLLSPVLASPDVIANAEFPSLRTLRVHPGDPDYWSEFQQRYCGGWSSEDRDRIRLLARMWIDETEDADEAARRLEPLLAPLEFESFTSSAPADKRTQPGTDTGGPGDPDQSRPPEPTPPKRKNREQEKVKRRLMNLRAWLDDPEKNLVGNAELRRFLAEFIRTSVRWDEERSPPIGEWKRLLGGADEGNRKYDFILIEGQGSKPAATPFFISEEFPRAAETRDLLEALVRFSYEGERSWNFPNGEFHKRVAARWLRKHQVGLLTRLNPKDGLDTRLPVAAALEFLCVAAVLRLRAKLPADPEKLVAAVLGESWNEEEIPAALCSDWQSLVQDMAKRHKDVRDFVLAELAVIQGRTGGQNFIDPLPILDAARGFAKDPRIQALAPEYFEGYWKTRYHSLNAAAYANLPKILEAERAEVRALVTEISGMLKALGYDPGAPKEAVKSFVSELVDVMAVKSDTKFYLPDDAFDVRFRRETAAADAAPWGKAIEAGRRVADGETIFGVLLYDARPLQEAAHSLRVARSHVVLLEKEVADQDQHQSIEGDPLELERKLLLELEAVAELSSARE